MELTLSTGVRLRLRPVPQHESERLRGQEEAKIGPAPASPIRKLKSPLTGTIEDVPAGEGDPEYDEWFQAMEEWSALTAEARAMINTRLIGLWFDYGVVEWCLDYDPERADMTVWETDPPEDWRYPPALERAGLSSSDNSRLDYIFIELVPRGVDHTATLMALRDETYPLTNAEVEAQLGGFRSAGQSEKAAEGQRGQPLDLSRGDGSRKSVGLIARLLGKRKSR